MRQALELFKTSTMDAVKSGLMDVAVFTDEQRCVARWRAHGWACCTRVRAACMLARCAPCV